jgi:hypothetical protein
VIRLASKAARFKHGGAGGFDLTSSWTEFKSLTEKQRALLPALHGRWIRIHPDDRGELAKFGLRFVSGIEPLALIEASDIKLDPADAKPSPPVKAKPEPNNEKISTTDKTTKPKAEKADEKKG